MKSKVPDTNYYIKKKWKKKKKRGRKRRELGRGQKRQASPTPGENDTW